MQIEKLSVVHWLLSSKTLVPANSLLKFQIVAVQKKQLCSKLWKIHSDQDIKSVKSEENMPKAKFIYWIATFDFEL